MKLCRCVGVWCGVAAGLGIAVAAATFSGGQAVAQPGAQAAPAGLKIATIDVLRAIERHMARPELDAARAALVESWQSQLNTADAELKQLQDQARTLTQADPKMQELYANYQAKQESYQQLSQSAQAEIDKLSSRQMVEGYDAVRGAVKTIAARGGYTIVLMSRPAGEPIDPLNQNMVIQQILARPVLEAAGGTDITDAVIAELKLPAAPAPTPPQAPPAPPGSGK